MSSTNVPSDGASALPKGKVAYCDVVLVEARSRIRIGTLDARLDELVARAGEILDDLDTVLVTLDPLRHASDFATAARLHRDLEQIQSAIPSSSRRRPVPEVRSSGPRHPQRSADRADREVP